MLSKRYRGTFELTIVALVLAVHALPALFVILSGFFGEVSIVRWDRVSFDSFIQVFSNSDMMNAIGQSVYLAFISSSLCVPLVFVFLSATRFFSRKGRLSSRLIYLPVSFPDIIWALGFLILIKWGIATAGFSMVLVVHLTFNLALASLVVYPAVMAVEQEQIDAAIDLGATFLYLVRFVILREILPTLFAAFALCFIFSFDDFVLTFLLGGTEVQTVPLYLYGKLKYGASREVVGLASLAALFGTLAIGVSFLLTSRRANENLK